MKKLKNKVKDNNWIWALLGAAVLWLCMGISSGRLNLESFLTNAYVASFLAILTFGQMLVVTSGRGAIDLSIPGVLTLMAFVSMGITDGKNSRILPALLVSMLLAVLIGMFNAFMVIVLQLPAIIATMASNYILTTAALLINRNFSVFVVAPVLQKISRDSLLGVPIIIYITLIVAGILWFLLYRTAYGKSLLCMGQNRSAAQLAGVKVVTVEIFTYIFSSILATIGGILIAARVGGALLGMGNSYMMETVAAIVVGGTLMSGGKANIPGTLAGCLFLSLVVTAMQIMGFSVGIQNIAKGVLIIGVLIIGSPGRKRKRYKERKAE